MTRPLNEWGIPVGSSMDRDTWPAEVRARLCNNPLGHHVASAQAEVAAVPETRCIVCHARIYGGHGMWSVAS